MTDSVFPSALISWLAVIGFCWSLLAAGVVIEWVAERIVGLWAARRGVRRLAEDRANRRIKRAAHRPARIE